MPAQAIPVFDETGLTDPFRLPWNIHPQQGVLAVPRAMNVTLQRYLYDECAIEVDIGGPPVTISRCSVRDYNGNFATGAGVLLGDNDPGVMPLHLTFTPPLLEAGAHVSATGDVGRPYVARCTFVFASGSSRSVSNPGTISRERGTAPFVGMIATAADPITEAWFDAIDPSSTAEFTRVAIDDLLFEP